MTDRQWQVPSYIDQFREKQVVKGVLGNWNEQIVHRGGTLKFIISM